MPVAKTDESKHAPETGQAFSRNHIAVLEDHARYKQAAARHGLGAVFEVVLETGYDLTPQPVAEEAVPALTAQAVEALAEERSFAGGRPLDTAAVIPELEMEDLFAVDAAAEGDTPTQPLGPVFGDLPTPGAGSQDLMKLAEILEGRLGSSILHRLNQIDGALAGLGFRLQVVSKQLEQQGGGDLTMTMPTPSGPLPGPVAPPAEPAPTAGTPPAEALSLAQRRELRRNGIPVPELGVPITAPETVPAAPAGPGRRVPLAPSRRSLSLRITIPLAAAAALLISLPLWSPWSTPQAGASAMVVERQAQGLGAYVRAEERALRAVRTPSTEEFLQARAQVLAATGQEREVAQQRLTEMVREAEAFTRAQRALGVLYQVSGISPEVR